MACPNCGSSATDSDRLCPACVAQLSSWTPPQPEAAPTPRNGARESRKQVFLLAGLVLVVMGALVFAHFRNTDADTDQLVNAAIDQVFFERHRYIADPDLIRPAIRQWHEQFSRYTPEIVYHGVDRATVTFRSGNRTIAREEMRRYKQGTWMRPIPFRRHRRFDSFYPPPPAAHDGYPQHP